MGINRTFLVTCTILVENLNELYIFTFFSLILFAKSVLSFSPCVCILCACMCDSQTY